MRDKTSLEPEAPSLSISQWLFAVCYDTLNAGVEGRLKPYREQTAGRAWGDVLEIGAGTGANLPFYSADVRLTVMEPNPHMARRLRRNAAKQGLHVTILPDVGEKSPFPDASFDSVVTTLVLCMVDDMGQVLREARRVLRPGGALLFYEHVVSPNHLGRWWQHKLNPVWRFVTTGCNLDRDIAGAIRDAGFKTVELDAFDLSVGVPITIPNIIGLAVA